MFRAHAKSDQNNNKEESRRARPVTPVIGLIALAMAFVIAPLATLDNGEVIAQEQTEANNADAKKFDEIKIGLVIQKRDKKYSLSRMDYPAKDDGISGAKVAIKDNNTTGRFTKQKYSLKSKLIGKKKDPTEVVQKMTDDGISMILLDLPADQIVSLAEKFKDVTFFNISAKENILRQESCRSNLMHIAPSRSMLTDAIVQYLVFKKWTRVFLLAGGFPADKEYAASLRKSAKKYGAKIVEEREYKYKPSAARTDGGHELIKKQMLTLTQSAKSHHVVAVADESQIFGAYVPYRTAEPRPVVGTFGLTPMTFHTATEQWGASQFQNRFRRVAKRDVKPVDYSAFIAVRAIGEAATRMKSSDPEKLAAYLKGPEFSIPGFKGQKLTFRDWNYQLRQPIMLTNRHMTVSWSPQEGFLHQNNLTDSLGIDKPESKCKF